MVSGRLPRNVSATLAGVPTFLLGIIIWINYNLAVYIGRFQPYHKGHFQTLITFGFELAPKVLILVGSHPYKRTTKNPFTFSEREQMILESLEPHKATHCTKVQPIHDCSSDAAWANHVDDIVKQYEKDDSKITLIGDQYIIQILNI